MQPRTVINKNAGKYRTTNEIQESTGQLQKYRNLQDYRTAGISETKLNVGAQLKTFPYPTTSNPLSKSSQILINDSAESSPKSL